VEWDEEEGKREKERKGKSEKEEKCGGKELRL
jgi:hypothetical protein